MFAETTGQEALEKHGMPTLIGQQCVVACGVTAAGPLLKIGVIVDPNACSVDEDNPKTALYVEIEGDDDYWLYELFDDESFVLLGDLAASK
jgi:hypothetical protein